MEARRNQKLRWGTAALCLLLVLGGVVAADKAATIRDTFSRLLSENSDSGRAGKDILVLVETLGEMAERTKAVPPEVRSKIRAAGKAFHKDPSPRGPGGEALRLAWKEYNSGRPCSFPEGAKDRAAIAKEIRYRVDSCIKAIEGGDGAQAVKDLLEALLMVLTPLPVRSDGPA